MFNPWERRYWSQLGFHVFPWCNGYNNNPCNIYYKSYNVNGRRAWVAKLLNLMTDLNYHHSDDNSSHHMSVGRLVIMIGYRKYILEVLAIIPHHWLVNLPCIYIYYLFDLAFILWCPTIGFIPPIFTNNHPILQPKNARPDAEFMSIQLDPCERPFCEAS